MLNTLVVLCFKPLEFFSFKICFIHVLTYVGNFTCVESQLLVQVYTLMSVEN